MTRRESNKETTTMNLSPRTAPASGLLRDHAARSVVLVACVVGAWLALVAAPATATVVHQSEGSFNGSDRTIFGPFEGLLPSAVVDRSNGDVWITEAKDGGFLGKADAVDKFNAKGEYAGVQIEGTPMGKFNFGVGGGVFTGIAVDNTASGPNKGDLYVSDSGTNEVQAFTLPTSGSYTLTYEGKTTASILFSATAEEVQAALERLSTIGAGNVEVESENGKYLIKFINALADTNVEQITASGGSPAVVVSTVTQGAARAVDRFTETGTYLCQISAKVPSTAPEKALECNGAAGSEPTSGPGIEPAGLAVDAAGDLYVADDAHQAIDVFEPSGKFLRQITDSHLGSGLATIALDSAGNLYVTNFGENVVKFDSSGHFASVIEQGEAPAGVSVDPTNNHVYVDVLQTNSTTEAVERLVAEYEPSGARLDVFAVVPTGDILSLSYLGVAVGPTGKVYVAEPLPFYPGGSGKTVQIYSPDVAVPTVTTHAATSVTESTATVHGHVDPDTAHGGGEITSCRFEYGPTTAYGETAPCSLGPPYSSPEDVSAEVKGLRPSSTYHFRLQAANSNGIPSYGEDETLTAPGRPSIDSASAEALQTVTIFRARIDPWGYKTSCQLQYVSDTSFKTSMWANATTVPCNPGDLGSGFGDVTVKVRLPGLTGATVYHYRLLAENQSGLTGTPDSTFETFNIEEVKVEDLKSGEVFNPGNQNYEWRPGEPSTQAGEHPYAVATTVALNKTTIASTPGPSQGSAEYKGTIVNTRNIQAELPPGLIGNPTSTPLCPHLLVTEEKCPTQTQVGLIWVYGSDGYNWYALPVYNVVPANNVPAEFGAFIEGQAGAWIQFHVRTGSDYGVSADSMNIISGVAIEKVTVVVWGVPASPAHDGEGERRCLNGQVNPCPDPEPQEKPLLTNPTSCAGPQSATVSLDSWQEPESWLAATSTLPGFTGCDKLSFEPTFEALPTTELADSPSGLHVDLHVPQNEEPKGLATADLRNAKVVLPAGVTVNPSASDGLEACSEAQIGYLPQKSAEVGHPQFTPGAAECPDASKIGKVEVDSRLIDHPLHGAVYVAAQDANPFKSLLAVYIAVYDAQTGVVVKLPGKITPDPLTGQLTATFDENPQLPFEDFKLDFFEGSRATLTTPLTCGSYTTESVLTPWSGTAPVTLVGEPGNSFTVASGPNGTACASSEAQAPNGPGFTAGTASPIAATYSPFVLGLEREDGSQRFSGLNVTLPPGLIGKIAGLERCSQAAIEAAQARSHEGEGAAELAHPSCPAGSEVGVVHVGAGSGAPYYVTGHAYFAGPYNGAPFSLVIVTPAVAGPFDLGTVVVRAGLYIDPSTAQVTVKSDPFPTILDGIPLDIRSVSVEANRREFTLNPTSCSVMSVTGQESSAVGQTAALSDRFQAGGCTTLPFHPSFTAFTSGKSSKADGASLTVKVAQHPGEANIHKVDLQLPIQMPSRLSTLQKACAAVVFEANPAGCPAASAVGSGTAITPLLGVPLTGPAYIVSHGGEAFPDVEFVLQGEGVKIVLDGKTQIKNGITYSHFETVPDAPISSFETVFPQGPDSILGTNVPENANYSLCGANLAILTNLTGQNGAIVNQNTKVAVTGCAKATLSRAQKLKAALNVCRRKDKGAKRRHKRELCERTAHKRYGPIKKHKTGK